jgi:hypothetical protein
MLDQEPSPASPSDEHLEAVDLFHTAWVKAFIRINHAFDLETVEILLSIGQQLMNQLPRRREHSGLDVVLATILRPALLAAKAADVNLRHGLYEPALAQFRTLLELDLALDHMLADPAAKDERANRYLAWSRKKRIGPLKEQLSNPVMRAQLGLEGIAWIKGRLHVYEAELEALSSAAQHNQKDHNWHPYRDVKGLAQHLGRLDDYVRLYAPMSNMNVHAADPETHLDIANDGTVRVKALATIDPRPVTVALNVLAGHLQQFLSRLLSEWSLGDTPAGRLLTAAQMRFVGRGDGTIPAELRPAEWATAIRLTQAPIADALEEAVQLILVTLRGAPDGLTQAQIGTATGLDATGLGDGGHVLLRVLLEHLAGAGAIGLDGNVEPPRFRAPTPK